MERYTIKTHTGIESSGKGMWHGDEPFRSYSWGSGVFYNVFFLLSMSPGMKMYQFLSELLIGFSPLVLAIGMSRYFSLEGLRIFKRISSRIYLAVHLQCL